MFNNNNMAKNDTKLLYLVLSRWLTSNGRGNQFLSQKYQSL